MSTTTGTMRVTIAVDVDVGPWGGEATFDSLYEQATREAQQKLSNLLQRDSSARLREVVDVQTLVIRRQK